MLISRWPVSFTPVTMAYLQPPMSLGSARLILHIFAPRPPLFLSFSLSRTALWPLCAHLPHESRCTHGRVGSRPRMRLALDDATLLRSCTRGAEGGSSCVIFHGKADERAQPSPKPFCLRAKVAAPGRAARGIG